MPRRRSKPRIPVIRAALCLAGVAIVLFGVGEAWRLTRSDAGRIRLARLGWGDAAEVTRLVGRQIRLGLEAVAVPRDSIRETPPSGARAAVRWRVGLPASGSPTQANYAVTRLVERSGGTVMEGREGRGPHGEMTVTLLVGIGKRATHEVEIVRAPRDEEVPATAPARLAVVLYGFGDDPEQAAGFFRLEAPFAVALAPGARWSVPMFRAAQAAEREIVLHLPLEPVNYPQVNPGPGTILVTMEPARITGQVRRYLDQAGAVSAVANHMGSLATQDMQVMGAVYRELRRRGVPFLHLQPAAGSVCKALASEQGVIYEEPDAVLDAETRGTGAGAARALAASWKRAVQRARERGHAVVMVRATPLVAGWLPKALGAERPESVVPLAALLRRPAAL
jgi:polysaccharide deacetylase 2 family uncharacterized protein YibQ